MVHSKDREARLNREARIDRINKALAQPQYEKPFTIGGKQRLLTVVEIDLSVPLLNHTTMRVAPNLEEMPEWSLLRDQPDSEEAQALIGRCVLDGGDMDEYEELKEQLKVQGQQEPGLMTTEGVLIQGNTRLIALRELRDEAGHQAKLSVAVIDRGEYDDSDLQLLDWEEQHREQKKRDYPLTNHLMSLYRARHESKRTEEQIAATMGMSRDEVRKQLVAYEAFEEMRHLPAQTITIERFNTLGKRNKLALEALKAVGQKWKSLTDEGKTEEATSLLWNWLLANMAGGEQTRDLRAIDANFADEFLLPLVEDIDGDDVAPADWAVSVIASAAVAEEEQVDELDPDDPLADDGVVTSDGQRVVRALVNALTTNESSIPLPNTPKKTAVARDDLEQAIGSVVQEAVQRAKDDNKADSTLQKPLKCLDDSHAAIAAASKALKKAVTDVEFRAQANKSKYELKLKRLRRTIDEFEGEVHLAFEEPSQ